MKIARIPVKNYLNFFLKRDYLLLKVIIQAKLLKGFTVARHQFEEQIKCDASRGGQDPPSIPTYVIQIEPLCHSFM